MNRSANPPAEADIVVIWRRFKSAQADVLENWVEAERAVALAKRDGSINGGRGDRLLAAEAALQGAIIDFAAASQRQEADPTPIALGLLRLAERELAADPTA